MIFILLFMTGLILGFVMHRSDFCVAGMLRDIFMFNRFNTAYSLFFLLILSAVLYLILYLIGVVNIEHAWTGFAGGHQLFGGFVFGVGMVLAGGCVIGTLYKAGAGNFSSIIAFLGLLFGSFFYAIIYPYMDSVAPAMRVTSGFFSFYEYIPFHPLVFVAFFAVVYFMLFKFLKKRELLFVKSYARHYLQPFYASIIMAFCFAFIYYISKLPIGVTSSYTKMSAFLTSIFSDELYNNMVYYHKTILDFYNTTFGVNIKGKLDAAFDGVYLVQLPVVLGVLFGSMVSAVKINEFTVNLDIPKKQVLIAFSGGILMGFASRLAGGCNVWYLFGQMPLLDLGAYFFLGGLLPGVWFGSFLLTNFIVGVKK